MRLPPVALSEDLGTLAQALDDGTVTVRERDHMTQVRVAIDELSTYLLERVTWH